MSYVSIADLQVEQHLFNFIEHEVLPAHPVIHDKTAFWQGFAALLQAFSSRNRALLAQRDALQAKLDDYHRTHPGPIHDVAAYRAFLQEIGYVVAPPGDFHISTERVDDEIARQAGSQLVVPVTNARYALNAANARWGSLYDALYGTDVIEVRGAATVEGYDPVRGAAVIAFVRQFLDETIPLRAGSHAEAVRYHIAEGALRVDLQDGTSTTLQDPDAWRGFVGSLPEPSALLFVHHGLHFEIQIDRNSPIGQSDLAGVKDVLMEAALTTIMDCEDSVAAVDGADKTTAYRHWLGLLTGSLSEEIDKGGKRFVRTLNPDRRYLRADGSELVLHGRSLLLIRNVGHLMSTPAVLGQDGQEVPEGLLDGVMTGLLAAFDRDGRNSRTGSVYIVKPKMHGPEEVRFANEVFNAVEDLCQLPRHTLKIGIMDEERRTSINLKACIYEVRERVVFINTGFLDRTGDEIHSVMYAGPVVRKGDMKASRWIDAYERSNTDIGLRAGLPGRAQIGKGMWAMPDKMAAMLEQKIAHPRAGATTAWVPSPTAATLHSLHYHRCDVFAVQQNMLPAAIDDRVDALLSIPVVAQPQWSAEEIQQELDNNCQGLLGYVVRWIDQGVGCSKVPDIHDVGLMEDRATLRISSQHIVNWLLHGVVSEEQVRASLARMAQVVDKQNAHDPHYQPMAQRESESLAYQAACALVFEGLSQPNGYTEPILHRYRALAKARN